MQDAPKPEVTPDLHAYFSAIAQRRRRVTKACLHCGATLEGVIARRRYCDTNCRNKAAYRKTHPEVKRPARSKPPPGGAGG